MSTLDDNWARSLTSPRLADDLRKLASNIRFDNPEARAARLREAARRLEEMTATVQQQILVTLDDGRQIARMHGVIFVRPDVAYSWSLPLDESSRPHVPGTWYVGEW